MAGDFNTCYSAPAASSHITTECHELLIYVPVTLKLNAYHWLDWHEHGAEFVSCSAASGHPVLFRG
jgi:hypothetical protein